VACVTGQCDVYSPALQIPEKEPRMEETTKEVTAAADDRKSYVTPTLTDFGSCAEITQGTFAGVGADSGIYS
jgi:hypothetical protein